MTRDANSSAAFDVQSFDRAVGTLSRNGELVGHLASRVLEMWFPSRQPWVWFVVVWLDGTKELKFEDYGPGWFTIGELVEGRFEHYGPSVRTDERLGWFTYQTRMPGPPMTFDFALLAPDVAAERWDELELVDADF